MDRKGVRTALTRNRSPKRDLNTIDQDFVFPPQNMEENLQPPVRPKRPNNFQLTTNMEAQGSYQARHVRQHTGGRQKVVDQNNLTSTTSVAVQPPLGFPPTLTPPPTRPPGIVSGRRELTTGRQGRERAINPQQVALMTERAARRNGLQNPLGSKENTSPSASTGGFGISPRPATTNLLRTLGVGYDSGIPSQLSRDPQVAAAVIQHASRDRYTERNRAQLGATQQRVMQDTMNITSHHSPSPSPSSSSSTAAVLPSVLTPFNRVPLMGNNPHHSPSPSASYSSSAAGLPSVLTPFNRPQLMSYKEAFDKLIYENGPLLPTFKHLEKRNASVVLYDTAGDLLAVFGEGFDLSSTADIRYVVEIIQYLLDEHLKQHELVHDAGARLLVQAVEIRHPIRGLNHGYPPLKGRVREGDNGGLWGKHIRWFTGGDMEKYWAVYRNVLQMGAGMAEKPILKVKTVRQIPLGDDYAFKGGHEFYDISGNTPSVEKANSGAEGDRGRVVGQVDGGADTGSERSSSSGQGVAGRSNGGAHNASQASTSGQGVAGGFNGGADHTGQASAPSTGGRAENTTGQIHNLTEEEMAVLAAAGVPQLSFDQISRALSEMQRIGEVGPSGEDIRPKEGAQPLSNDPTTQNWGYYQRMGGDKRMHKAFDLSKSKVPFNINEKKSRFFPNSPGKPFTTPDIFVTILEGHDALPQADEQGGVQDKKGRQAVKEFDSQGSLTPKASQGAVKDAADEERILKVARKFEAAISFEDTNSFLQNHDSEIPAERKRFDIVGDYGHFDRLQPAPDFHKFGAAGPKYADKGKGKERAEVHHDYGHFNEFNPQVTTGGAMGVKHDIKGKGKQTGFQGETSYNPFDQFLGPNDDTQHTSSHDTFGGATRAAGGMGRMDVGPSRVESPATSFSSMNVHAPSFTNFRQFGQASSSNTQSPYLQSFSGMRPDYTNNTPYAQFGGQARPSTPPMRFRYPEKKKTQQRFGSGGGGEQYNFNFEFNLHPGQGYGQDGV